MSKMVERVAAALKTNKASLSNPEAESLARAAIWAMRDPTQPMVEFGDAVRGNHADYAGGNGTENLYRAMIDQALKD